MEELVTVVMLSYNHALWVEQALRSVAEQKTSFKIKIIVHDDASTDNSQEVINKIAKIYPDVILPIFQEINQMSRGIPVFLTYIMPLIKSKYIAFCECDDFWISNGKLQAQIDYMENHNNCTFVFSNAVRVDLNGEIISPFYPTKFWKDQVINNKLKSKEGADFTTEEVILLDFVPTASTVCRYSTIYEQVTRYGSIYDLINRIYCTNDGYAHYFPEKLTAYRTGNINSASGRAKSSFESMYENYYKRSSDWLDKFDVDTKGKYHNIIEQEKNRKLLQCNLAFKNMKEVKKSAAYDEVKISRKTKIFLNNHFNRIYSLAYKGLQVKRRIFEHGKNKIFY